MTNQFTDKYKAIPTSKLLEIIENRKDYQSLAIEAAKLELACRQDIEAAKHELKEKSFQTQKKAEDDKQKRKEIQGKAFKVLEYADPLVEQTPDRSIVIICVLLLLMFLYKAATSFSLLISAIKDIADADFSIYWFLLDFFYLPLALCFLWKKTKIGWTMILVWLIYQIVMDLTYLYMCYQLSRIDNHMSRLIPLPGALEYFFVLFFHAALVYFICKKTTVLTFKNSNMMKRNAILITIFLTTFNLFGQTIDFVKSDSIIYPIHKANIGKIAFMGTTVPIENFKQSDFITSFELKEKTNLNIRVFLENSLTNSLHLLSSQLTADELTKNGNYQFTFFIDGKMIYVENINIGAGSADSKNQRTVFRIPLISSTNEDSWGRFLWNRFLTNGGQEAFTSGEHLLKIEIRPYLKITEVLTGSIIAEGQIKIKVPEININEKRVKLQAIKRLKDWQISTDKIDTAKMEELNRKIATQAYKDITSVVVIKEGKLFIEEYFNGASRKSLHDTRSVGKSFASTLLGIAIKDGYLKSEAQTLNEFYNLKSFQNYSASKDSITLKSLLTMSSAFEGSDINTESPGHEENMYPTKNWVAFALNLPVDKTKVAVKRWDYFTAGVVVLGDIIHQSVPNGLEKYADKNLFRPLNIIKYKWQFTPQKVANTAGGLQLRSLDYAKFGQLYKNQGTWNGKQILSQDWITKSLSHQMTISEEEYYGYLFWNKTYKIDGVDYEVYYSSGNGGNRIFIFKDQPIVIVITSTAYNTPYGQKQVDKMMQDYLIPAIIK